MSFNTNEEIINEDNKETSEKVKIITKIVYDVFVKYVKTIKDNPRGMDINTLHKMCNDMAKKMEEKAIWNIIQEKIHEVALLTASAKAPSMSHDLAETLTLKLAHEMADKIACEQAPALAETLVPAKLQKIAESMADIIIKERASIATPHMSQ